MTVTYVRIQTKHSSPLTYSSLLTHQYPSNQYPVLQHSHAVEGPSAVGPDAVSVWKTVTNRYGVTCRNTGTSYNRTVKTAEFAQSTLVHRCDRQTDILYYNCPDLSHTNIVKSSRIPTDSEGTAQTEPANSNDSKTDSKWCTLRRSRQDILCCQNITRFHCTRVKVMLLTATTQQLRPSGKCAPATGRCGRCLAPHCYAQDTDRVWLTSCNSVWFST